MYRNGKEVITHKLKRKGVSKMEKKQGTVKWFSMKKGFGFIAGDDGEDYFIHRNQLSKSGYDSIEAGTRVEFEIEQSSRTGRGPSVSLVIVLKEQDGNVTDKKEDSADYPSKA